MGSMVRLFHSVAERWPCALEGGARGFLVSLFRGREGRRWKKKKKGRGRGGRKVKEQ